MTLDRPARIGNCSGYYGDRLSAFREMLEGGDLDYLTGDYLAELTMLILGKDQMKDPSTGYAKTFVRQLEDGLALALEKGVKVVTNAGGLNPAGLADRIREIATAQGLDVRVAHVEGDDLKARAAELDLPGDALTVNAYLGAFGIAAALEAGADVVVTGRVTDASVVMGPAIHAHGWGRDDLDALAGALVAGHVIECGTQATGGNFSGFRSLDTSAPLGFPIAEVAADGSSVVTKHARVEGRGAEGQEAGGAVTVDTVTAQLVYEIQGPTYLNPDVVAHLDTVELTQDGPDRVRIAGVRGTPPPATTKVCLNLIGGFRNSVELLLTGLDIEAKAAWVRRQVTDALQSDPPDELVWTLDRTDVFDPPTQAAATSLLRCVAKSARPEPVGRTFSDAFVNVALASYPGFTLTAPPGRGAPFGVYRPAYVPQSEVPHVVVHPDGRREEIAPPTGTADLDEASASRPAPAPDLGDTRAVPLGELVHARSGDKGGDANVGLWVPAEHPRRDDAVAWLLGVVNPGWVQAMLPEAADLDVDVHPLPNLGGVNIVIHGLLGEGVSSSTRLDPQAKALGEWLRARVTAVPLTLLEGARP